MKWNESSRPSRTSTAGELELELQEALARRQRASELFGAPDWDSDGADEASFDYVEDDD
jgi:hypothetical protein